MADHTKDGPFVGLQQLNIWPVCSPYSLQKSKAARNETVLSSLLFEAKWEKMAKRKRSTITGPN
jgi:hypothetical protein